MCRDSVTVGNGCIFGSNTFIYDHDHRFSKAGVCKSEYSHSAVRIGDNCWIGANVVILKGTTIGDNCIVGAGTVLGGKIPSNSIVITDRKVVVKEIM